MNVARVRHAKPRSCCVCMLYQWMRVHRVITQSYVGVDHDMIIDSQAGR